MIVGLGADLVEIARVARLLERRGTRAARRILTPAELEGFLVASRQAQFLARRFAAKEAAVKALGTGFREGIGLRQIEIGHDRRGRPLLALHGPARARLEALGACRAHLTLSDERGFALAVVVLEG